MIDWHLLILNYCSNMYSTNGNVLLGAMQGLGVFVILFYLLTRSRIKYVRELSDGLEEISSGNLDFRVRKAGNDELRLLSENVNLMTGKLQEKIENEIRVEKSRPSTEGSGLGLAIAKSIMDLHGGEISASSEGNEITFSVRLKTVND